LQISQYAKLITENWLIADSDLNFVSLEIRFFGKQIAADFAFVVSLSKDDDIHFITWIVICL